MKGGNKMTKHKKSIVEELVASIPPPNPSQVTDAVDCALEELRVSAERNTQSGKRLKETIRKGL